MRAHNPVAVVLIKNARLVDPEAGIDGPRDVLVASGRVVLVSERISPDEARRTPERAEGTGPLLLIEGDGLWLWPGLVDVHVHFREPGFTHKETLRTGSMAAAAGGYTSVICEPNTEPPIDSIELVRHLASKARAESVVNVCFKAAMTEGRRGEKPTDVAALAQHESVAALSDDGDPVVDPAVMEDVCREAARADIPVTPHCEDSPAALQKRAAGVLSGFEPDAPNTNEANYVKRDLELAARAGCRIHFSHVSLARTVDIIKQFRTTRNGAPAATFEVTPHHLLLCTGDFAQGEVPGVNPPLRSAQDRDALQHAMFSGEVDAIASDHAPHTAEDKARGASGLIGLETTLGLVLSHFVGEGKLSVSDAVRLLSTSPARIFGLPAGTLSPGARADMTLIDPRLSWTVNPAEFRSRSRNTPFGGWQLRGKAMATFAGGQEVYADPAFELRKTLWEAGGS